VCCRGGREPTRRNLGAASLIGPAGCSFSNRPGGGILRTRRVRRILRTHRARLQSDRRAHAAPAQTLLRARMRFHTPTHPHTQNWAGCTGRHQRRPGTPSMPAGRRPSPAGTPRPPIGHWLTHDNPARCGAPSHNPRTPAHTSLDAGARRHRGPLGLRAAARSPRRSPRADLVGSRPPDAANAAAVDAGAAGAGRGPRRPAAGALSTPVGPSRADTASRRLGSGIRVGIRLDTEDHRHAPRRRGPSRPPAGGPTAPVPKFPARPGPERSGNTVPPHAGEPGRAGPSRVGSGRVGPGRVN
jgi:hypothetical protein